MRRAVAPIFALLLATPLAQGEGPADETRFTLRHEMLRMINHDREAHGLKAVELDPETSVVADSYCRQQIRNGTTGHFTIDGEAPYMRYSFAGGNDGVSENAAAWSATYTFSDRALYEMMRLSEDAMMAEKPPHDGHRRTILDPFVTHVGIGLAWEKGEFRLTQEFVRRYLQWSRPLPRAAGLYEDIVAAAKPREGYRVEAISVHHEQIPQSLAPATANLIESYKLPDDRREYLPRLRSFTRRTDSGAIEVIHEEYSDGRRGDFSVNNDGSFRFNVPFSEGPGIYTVVVWVKGPGNGDVIAASNVSIRVDRPVSGFAGGGSR
jgi:uncharacterized protein YkwD